MSLGRLSDDGDETQAVFSEINITPLTDIFLVLLIIFMVGASMAVQTAAGESGGESSGVEVALPRGASKDLAPASEDVAVAILADGRVVVRGEEVEANALETALTEAQQARGSSTLIIQADEGVAHGRVVAVMEAARAAGFERLAVATRAE